jgi:hypothetical protein
MRRADFRFVGWVLIKALFSLLDYTRIAGGGKVTQSYPKLFERISNNRFSIPIALKLQILHKFGPTLIVRDKYLPPPILRKIH